MPKLYIIGAIVVLVLGLIGYKTYQVSSLKDEIAMLEQSLDEAKSSIILNVAETSKCKSKLLEQNMQIKQLEAEKAELNEKDKKNIATIKKLKKPKNNEDKEVRRYFEDIFDDLSNYRP